MDKFIANLLEKTILHIEQLKKQPKYEALQADINFSQETNKEGLSFSTNAGLWLSNSQIFSKEITDFLKSEYETASVKKPLLASIKIFKEVQTEKKSIKGNTTTPRNEKNTESLEQAEFRTEKPKYKLKDVILPEETLNSIKEAISTIESFDLVYNQWNFKSKEPSAKTNICFWGAPGTGKTMCAHAIADNLGKDILIASYADIQSQYVGVGPKNLRAVFQVAEEKEALLFFDEADSFLRKRTSDNSSSASMHYNSMTNEMMKHLEDFNGIVIFATNLTENTDEAFKTRLSFSIEFKEPDNECRAKIIEMIIPKEVPLATVFSPADYTEMAEACEGFVGRDIRNSIKTILSVGAQKQEFPFTKQHFLDGFRKYKENKESFTKDKQNDKKSNPMDIYTANGCIHNLLTYAAWADGKENEIEAEYLKLFSKILSRNKLVVNSIKDLPDFEDICHEITDDSLKKKALRYFAFFMAMTNQEDEIYRNILNRLTKQLSIPDEFILKVEEYYNQARLLYSVRENVK